MCSRDLTTGEVARHLRVSQQTVIRAFDSGIFPHGYRLLGSKFRRIPPREVRMVARGLNIQVNLGEYRGAILVVDQGQGMASGFRAREQEVTHARDILAGMYHLGIVMPELVVLVLETIPMAQACEFAAAAKEAVPDIIRVCTYPEGTATNGLADSFEKCIPSTGGVHITSKKILDFWLEPPPATDDQPAHLRPLGRPKEACHAR